MASGEEDGTVEEKETNNKKRTKGRHRNGMAHVLQYRHDSWVLAGESLSLNCFYLTYLLNAAVCLFIVCDHCKSFDC